MVDWAITPTFRAPNANTWAMRLPKASAEAAADVPQSEHQDPWRVGPILYFQGCHGERLNLAAVFVCPDDQAPPEVTVGADAISPEVIHRRDRLAVLRYPFSLPAAGGAYEVADERFEVAGIDGGDLRLAYLSCNGQEHGDSRRSLAERNVMWQRLARQHATAPLNLLLQGGDQLYADEMLDVHPNVQAWANGAIRALADDELEVVGDRLRSYLLKSYVKLYSQSTPAWLLARVPSLCMWDDHDICDGWGSLSAERMDSAIGKAVFQAAREFFLLFQLGCSADNPSPLCVDRTGKTLTWAAKLPGVLIVAPDLRSERRPERLLGSAGWEAFEQTLRTSNAQRVLVLSSVPVLGPRLSWVEAVMHYVPGAQKYEDDLRDQWQSRWHRDEWRRFLRTMLNVHEGGNSPVTVLSGEIHLATRCTMAAAGGPLHQLIASGIAHPPPPRSYARMLGTLARMGEAPLPAHPIRLHPLPGRRSIYTAQRNYLVLERSAGRWFARWELEIEGATPVLEI